MLLAKTYSGVFYTYYSVFEYKSSNLIIPYKIAGSLIEVATVDALTITSSNITFTNDVSLSLSVAYPYSLTSIAPTALVAVVPTLTPLTITSSATTLSSLTVFTPIVPYPSSTPATLVYAY